MKRSKHLHLILFFVFLLPLTLACSISSMIDSGISFPTLEAAPGDAGTPTGSSPMSGDWGAQTDFGKITFRISPDGKTLETMYIEMHNWTCGGITLTTSLQARTDPPSTVDNGSFGMSVNLADAGEHYHDILVTGQYDEANNKFTGEWQEEAFSTTCTGTWETIPRP